MCGARGCVQSSLSLSLSPSCSAYSRHLAARSRTNAAGKREGQGGGERSQAAAAARPFESRGLLYGSIRSRAQLRQSVSVVPLRRQSVCETFLSAKHRSSSSSSRPPHFHRSALTYIHYVHTHADKLCVCT